MLQVCVCVLSRYLSPVVENGICYMLNVMCAVSLSHPNSREWYLLYVKCLCLLSRYLSPSSREWHLLYVKSVVSLSQSSSNGICYMLNLCLLSRYLSPVVENGICYMLNDCVCCLVISAQ